MKRGVLRSQRTRNPVRPVADLTSTASHTGTRHCVEYLEIDLALRTTCETLKTLARVFAIFGDLGERRLGIHE